MPNNSTPPTPTSRHIIHTDLNIYQTIIILMCVHKFFLTFPHEHAETLKEKAEVVLAAGSAVVNPDVNPIAGTFMRTDIVRTDIMRTDIMRTVISCDLHCFSLMADTALHR
jgi:hypothetical protein